MKRHAKNLCAFKMWGKLESIKFHETMTPAPEQCDTKKNLETVQTIKSEIKQSIKAAIPEKVYNFSYFYD